MVSVTWLPVLQVVVLRVTSEVGMDVLTTGGGVNSLQSWRRLGHW